MEYLKIEMKYMLSIALLMLGLALIVTAYQDGELLLGGAGILFIQAGIVCLFIINSSDNYLNKRSR